MYQLSDDQMEYQIIDRISFIHFLGLNNDDDIPNNKTISHFRNAL